MTDWPAEVERLRAAHIHDHRVTITPKEIIGAVCGLTLIPYHELIGTFRREDVLRARVVATGVLREMLYPPPSFAEIARMMCRVTHSTTHHGYQSWRCKPEWERRRWLDEVHLWITRARPDRPGVARYADST